MSITKVIITIALIIFVILGLTYLFNLNKPIGTENSERVFNLAKYFQERLITLGVEDIGQPIEGFDPNLLILAFPGLEETDFQGVEALEGHYEFRNGTLELVRDQENPISSAERMVTSEGYAILLRNVSTRLNIEITNKASVDNLIETLNTGERIEAKIGQAANFLGVNILPQEILEDSRCPIDVTCIQAGTVRVRTLLTSGSGEAPQIFELNQPITTEVEEITLIQIDPQAQAGVEIQPKDYVFIFEIKKR